jgi:hypothetical protein
MLWLGIKLGLIRSVMIMPYKGFGNEKELFFPGRVVRDRGIGLSQVDASFNDIIQSATSDEEGYFEFRSVSLTVILLISSNSQCDLRCYIRYLYKTVTICLSTKNKAIGFRKS